MEIKINNQAVTVHWEDNTATQQLMEVVQEEPIYVQTSRYANVEQVGPLPMSLPTNDQSMDTKPGDIMFYQGNHLVVFFGHHSWSYTKLGTIHNLTTKEIKQLLNLPKTEIKISASAT